ncbi:hypothetical protein LN042_11650 [Kitasatospora sp. RB6PN24]|uniref:hypothetical protein n=1 Tax=Kitasatospora humi TaxID=2893891 RepID=UPI001E290BD2|nr:hypothetical protein [Kitasatospora humi]MCC9307744.1 hypothetical protein [Kitasatospora humi]
MSREPISEERLAALREMQLDTIVPQAARWNPTTRRQAEHWLNLMAPVIRELLDEIDELDADLDDAEGELDAALTELKRLAPEQAESKHEPVISAVWLERVDGRQRRVRWREDGKQRSQTFKRLADARCAYEDLRRRQYRGGAR